VTVVVHLS